MASPFRLLLGFGVVVAACSGTYEGSAPPSDAGTGADVSVDLYAAKKKKLR